MRGHGLRKAHPLTPNPSPPRGEGSHKEQTHESFEEQPLLLQDVFQVGGRRQGDPTSHSLPARPIVVFYKVGLDGEDLRKDLRINSQIVWNAAWAPLLRRNSSTSGLIVAFGETVTLIFSLPSWLSHTLPLRHRLVQVQ